jgi:hypothetical protein
MIMNTSCGLEAHFTEYCVNPNTGSANAKSKNSPPSPVFLSFVKRFFASMVYFYDFGRRIGFIG